MDVDHLRLRLYVQWGLLAIISILILGRTPTVWNFTPDGGIYVGTAVELIEQGRYWFNGYPNLIYYPGLSLLLAVFISAFGLDFAALHLCIASICIAAVWLCAVYYSPERYGWPGFFAPFLLIGSSIFRWQTGVLLSDGVFLFFVLAALFCWRAIVEGRAHPWLLWLCSGLVGYAAILRMEGLLLLAAFATATSIRYLKCRGFRDAHGIRAPVLVIASFLPFATWTVRNYLLHTPHTFSAVNQKIWGLDSMKVYGPNAFGLDAMAQRTPDYADKVLAWLAALWKGFLPVEAGLALWSPAIIVGATVIAAIGAISWAKRANIFELVYIAALLVLLFGEVIPSYGLYVVDRYWLSILPALSIGFAYGWLCIWRAASSIMLPDMKPRMRKVALVLVLGIVTLSFIRDWSKDSTGWMFGREMMRELLAEFVQREVPASAVVLTTDWGIVPFSVQRQAYLVLRSYCPDGSLNAESTFARIRQYRPAYLLILSGAAEVPFTQALARTYPEIFRPILLAEDTRSKSVAEVWWIDLEKLDGTIHDPCRTEG